jgi:hypothetical protein
MALTKRMETGEWRGWVSLGAFLEKRTEGWIDRYLGISRRRRRREWPWFVAWD